MNALRSLVPQQASVEIEVTETGWTPQGQMGFEQWKEAGQSLLRMGRAYQWWIGDWILYGEKHYGDRYTEAVDVTGLEYSTLRDIVWVCRAVDLSCRHDNLSWALHKEVASLPAPQQEEWLDKAAEQRMTRERLRSALRDAGVGNRKPKPEAVGDRTVEFVAQVSFVYTAASREDADGQFEAYLAGLVRRGAAITYKVLQQR
jgi:hypothetical protein